MSDARNAARDNVDPLEAELLAFRPAEPSRELFERVGRGLAVGPRPRWARPWVLGAAVAAAACVVLSVGVWRMTHPYVDPGPMTRVVPTPSTTSPFPGDADERPALAAYRRAWARSAADLDELLDRHAAGVLSGGTGAPAAAARFMALFEPEPVH